ncbi:MAG: FkbM family methyltransferase [Burkholderiaceae bacterium]|nr:MAG: FkbM family methyltransferase [Burkholderiaceae bacterium]
MKKRIKQLVKSVIGGSVQIAAKSAAGRYFLEQVLNTAMSKTRVVRHGDVALSFVVPNGLNHFRIDTFSSKEPEMLEWLDEIARDSVVWDVGANVGLYTCYAAKARHCQVFAFEPSVFNLELLARNIFLNGLADRATIVPLPLSDKLANSALNMTTTEWGGALSTFGETYTHDGQTLRKVFEFQTIGVSMDDAVERLRIPPPDYIKMDVDGIEHLILKGGANVLRNVKGVIIEINEAFEKQCIDSAEYLSAAGLVLKEKRHAEMFKDTVCFNQIWHRPSVQ